MDRSSTVLTPSREGESEPSTARNSSNNKNVQNQNVTASSESDDMLSLTTDEETDGEDLTAYSIIEEDIRMMRDAGSRRQRNEDRKSSSGLDFMYSCADDLRLKDIPLLLAAYKQLAVENAQLRQILKAKDIPFASPSEMAQQPNTSSDDPATTTNLQQVTNNNNNNGPSRPSSASYPSMPFIPSPSSSGIVPRRTRRNSTHRRTKSESLVDSFMSFF
ncbi:hypothetical protein QOT17_008517 [Balamuthia mandrillaris]